MRRIQVIKPANSLREIVPGLWCWSALHEEWKVDFSCCAWKGQGELVLIDPIELDAGNLAALEQVGRPGAILLTNQNHERHADWFRKKCGIKVHVHRDAVPGIEKFETLTVAHGNPVHPQADAQVAKLLGA